MSLGRRTGFNRTIEGASLRTGFSRTRTTVAVDEASSAVTSADHDAETGNRSPTMDRRIVRAPRAGSVGVGAAAVGSSRREEARLVRIMARMPSRRASGLARAQSKVSPGAGSRNDTYSPGGRGGLNRFQRIDHAARVTSYFLLQLLRSGMLGDERDERASDDHAVSDGSGEPRMFGR